MNKDDFLSQHKPIESYNPDWITVRDAQSKWGVSDSTARRKLFKMAKEGILIIHNVVFDDDRKRGFAFEIAQPQ